MWIEGGAHWGERVGGGRGECLGERGMVVVMEMRGRGDWMEDGIMDV